MTDTLLRNTNVMVNRKDPHLVLDRGPEDDRRLPATRILGVPISITDMAGAVSSIVKWAAARQGGMVCVRDVNSVMCAEHDARLQEVHERASMVTPDGTPLAIISRWRGHGTRRVAGPSLVSELCDHGRGAALRHFFYGGKEGVPEEMARRLSAQFPGLHVAGTFSPPFGQLTSADRERHAHMIMQSGANIVWVGISTPKQDFWMDEIRRILPGIVLIGVGAAFDFHSGAVARAPLWMQNTGLEWMHRLGSEPRRLWRRYLIMAPKFVWNIARSK